MQPDLLGEWYVLRKLEDKTLLTELSQLAWINFPEAMSVFIQRISQDFWEIEVVNALLGNINIQEVDTNILSNCANALLVHQANTRNGEIAGKVVQALDITVRNPPENTNATRNLGLCYHNGWGVEENASRAVDLTPSAYREQATSPENL